MSDWWYQYYMDKDEQAERTEVITDDPDYIPDDDSWYDVYIPNDKQNKEKEE